MTRTAVDRARTLFDKVWDSHVVHHGRDGSDLLYVDFHWLQEVSSPQAFEALRTSGRAVRRPDLTLATVDHVTPSMDRPREDRLEGLARAQIGALRDNCRDFGVTLYDTLSALQGIVHVIGPEGGWTRPGMTIVCGDSHTTTHGAFGALAFGIGSSEVEEVLATQCLWQRRPKTLLVSIDGDLPRGVTTKDVALGVIASRGTGAATGYAIEFAGSTIRAASMEARMTLCNMAIELGARIGMVAPDDVTADYFRGLPSRPLADVEGADLVVQWSSLLSELDSHDAEWRFQAADFAPTITWGTTPAMSVQVGGVVPDPDDTPEPAASRRALVYMDLHPGQAIEDIPIDRVFIGSCTNGRIEDLRAAAAIVRGRTVAPGVRALVVPGSTAVRLEAEQEGLAETFRQAGFRWGEAGCSMCVAMNGDELAAGERCAATTNRNFEGRQGTGGRTHLVSPAMAAAAAVYGHFCDVRELPQHTSESRA